MLLHEELGKLRVATLREGVAVLSSKPLHIMYVTSLNALSITDHAGSIRVKNWASEIACILPREWHRLECLKLRKVRQEGADASTLHRTSAKPPSFNTHDGDDDSVREEAMLCNL